MMRRLDAARGLRDLDAARLDVEEAAALLGLPPVRPRAAADLLDALRRLESKVGRRAAEGPDALRPARLRARARALLGAAQEAAR